MGKGARIVAGLDVGSTHVTVVILEIDGERRDVIGVSMVPVGSGMRAGHVVAIDRTIEAIRRAVDEASRMGDCVIDHVRLSVSGPRTMGFNENGAVAVRGGQVDTSDIKRALETASAVRLPDDARVLHTLPQEFVLDDHDGIRTPQGMAGVRLETRVHIVACSRTALTNAIECCNKAGLAVERAMFSGLASSASVLSDEERELGVVLVDVGGGTTDVSVWYDRALVHSVSMSCGGEELTRQIARGLCTPGDAAERIKCRHGCALSSMVPDGDTIQVPGVGGRAPQDRQRHVLCEIIEPSLEDFFARLGAEIEVAGCREHLAAGVVLTGGTSMLESIADLGSEVLPGLPVRVGHPTGFGGLADVVEDPRYSTAVGLCLDGFMQDHQSPMPSQYKKKKRWLGKVGRFWDAWF